MKLNDVETATAKIDLSLAERAAKRKAKATSLSEFTDTDMANATRLARRFGENLRYTAEQGWLHFDGRRWVVDEAELKIQEFAKNTVLAIFAELEEAADRDALYAHAKKSQSKNRIDAMIALARSEPGIPARLEDFDADPWLLNVANGTLDLRTGTLRNHDRDDLISKIAEVKFDRDAPFERWEAFMWKVCGGDLGLYAYLRRFVGYLLTGLTTEHVLHFLYGLGANGKSVFVEVLNALLGHYAIVVAPDLILAKRHSGIPNDVARLRGIRLASMNETPQGSRFDEAKLKDLTGGDSLSARFLHREFFQFKPTHKLAIRGNYRPAIRGTDEGIWRRLHLVPFQVAIPVEERDPHLLDKLCHELPGILRWAVEGCIEWQRDGLNPPAIVVDAVDRYRAESDILGQFIAERCEESANAKVASGAFFERYSQHCDRVGERYIAAKDLPGEMQRRGFDHKRIHGGQRVYTGLQFRETQENWWQK